MVLAAMTMLYLFGATFTVMVSNSVKKSQSQRAKERAFYVAESGLMRGIIKRMKYPTIPNHCFNFFASIDLNENANGNGTWADDNNKYTVEFLGVDAETLLPVVSDTTEIKAVRSTGEYRDTTGGRDVIIKSIQTVFVQTPFNREIHAEGGIDMESRFSTLLACVLPATWSGENNEWNIFGELYSRQRPRTDWRNQCCGILIAEPCFFGRCGCPWYRICCCPPEWCIGWRDEMGTKYHRIDKLGNPPFTCGTSTGGWYGDCNTNNADDEAEGEAGGGPTGSGRYFTRVNAQVPFPQFVPPPDPRLPGSQAGLTYMSGAACSTQMEANKYLRNVWCDGNLTVNKSWLALDFGFGIYGTVYVDGTFTYVPDDWMGISLSALKISTDDDSPPSGTSCRLPMAPGTLIVNKGNIEIQSAGTPDFGRVNIVAVNGNITLSSKCGMRARGFYYAGGTEVDPVTKKKTGGTITYSAGTWLTAVGAGLVCDTLGGLLQDIGIPMHSHTVLYGGFAAKDIKLVSITPCNVISQRAFATAALPSTCTDGGAAEIDARYGTYQQYGNTNLQVPDGFYHNTRIFNYRLLE